ncbi:MAG: hypothetical protein FJ044_00100 [Candidatus Cloacimonetes bacterium]|nr:hypothetical protein [Candidatus Cloacimonadota bacterium]
MLERILAYEPFLGSVILVLATMLLAVGAFVPAFALSVIAEIGAILTLIKGPESHKKVKPFMMDFLPGRAVVWNVVIGLLICAVLAIVVWK